VGTVTHDEKEKFQDVKERLRILLEHQITNFRFCFPFGRPEGALKATLSLLERVRRELFALKLVSNSVSTGADEGHCHARAARGGARDD
jgi:hypothetical protein